MAQPKLYNDRPLISVIPHAGIVLQWKIILNLKRRSSKEVYSNDAACGIAWTLAVIALDRYKKQLYKTIKKMKNNAFDWFNKPTKRQAILIFSIWLIGILLLILG